MDYFPDTLSVVQERNGIVWLKMKQAGFGYYNREKDRVEAFYNDAASSNYRMTNGITAFEIDPNNVIWLSPYYEKGLIKGVVTNSHQDAYHFEKILSTTHVDDIRALLNDRSGNLWIGTKNGNLYCYDVNHKLVHVYSHADSGEPLGRIYAIYEDDSHRLWIGTKGNGLWRLTIDGHSPAFKHYLHDPGKRTSISDNNIYSITQDYQGRLWLATFEGGLNLLYDRARKGGIEKILELHVPGHMRLLDRFDAADRHCQADAAKDRGHAGVIVESSQIRCRHEHSPIQHKADHNAEKERRRVIQLVHFLLLHQRGANAAVQQDIHDIVEHRHQCHLAVIIGCKDARQKDGHHR